MTGPELSVVILKWSPAHRRVASPGNGRGSLDQPPDLTQNKLSLQRCKLYPIDRLELNSGPGVG